MMPQAYPTGPRLLAGLGALTVGLSFGAYMPANLLANGFPITAWTMVATAVPLVAFLAALALFPEALQKGMSRFTRVDLRDGGHVAATIVMAGTLYFVLGYGSLVNGAYAYESEIVRGDEPIEITGDAILQGVVLNAVVLILPPVFYVAFVGNMDPVRALAALGIRAEGAARALFVGAVSAIGIIVLIAAMSFAAQGFSVEIPENERALQIARSVTVLGALGLAIGAGISEEVFFRGFLQPRIGLLGQAVFFALAHLSYVNVLEVVITFVLALMFGILYRATGNLLAPIAGHFTFNLIMLLAGIYAPDAT